MAASSSGVRFFLITDFLPKLLSAEDHANGFTVFWMSGHLENKLSITNLVGADEEEPFAAEIVV